MATVTDFSGNVKQVKNLGWLLKNWKLGIIMIEVEPTSDHGAKMRVTFSSFDSEYRPYAPQYYETDFASAEVLWHFIQRPVFYGIPLAWGKVGTHITKGAPFRPLEPYYTDPANWRNL